MRINYENIILPVLVNFLQVIKYKCISVFYKRVKLLSNATAAIIKFIVNFPL